MGHIRLGELPRSGYWKDVINKLGVSNDPSAIASITAKAAHKGLDLISHDTGLANLIYLFMKSFWSSKSEHFPNSVKNIGINIDKSSTILDFICELDSAMDKSLRKENHRSHLAEMARYSIIDSLNDMANNQTKSLFKTGIEETQALLKKYTNPKLFGNLGKNFFGKFLFRFLDYHVSREIANHIDPGEGPYKSVSDINAFRKALQTHCNETIYVIKDFTGCWPAAAEFESGLTAENVRNKFLPIAIKKIKSELAKR